MTDTSRPQSDGQLSDPNKQVFPLIPNTGVQLYPVTSQSLDGNEKAVFELPKINERTVKNYEPKENNALIPSLPRVPSNRKNTTKGQRGDPFLLSDKNHVPATNMPYQVQNFRSSSKIKMVPLSKRHRDMFTNLKSATVVMKQKQVPVHGRRFLWEEGPRETRETPAKCLSSKTLPEKFEDCEEQLEQFRSEKRKLEPYHRKKRDELQIGGATVAISERDNYSFDMQKLRQLPLPAHSQELFTGKGISLPQNHSCHRKREQWEARLDNECKAIAYSAPPIKMQTGLSEQSASETSATDEQKKQQPAAKVRRKSTTPKRKVCKPSEATRTVQNEKGKVKETGIIENKEATTKENMCEENHIVLPTNVGDEGFSETEQQMETDEKIQENEDDQQLIVEQEMPDSEMDIEYTSSDQEVLSLQPPRRAMPLKSVSPNLLKATDLSLYVTDDRKQKLTEQFKKLDTNKDGHITFNELKTTMSKSITKYQERFIKQVYEIVSSSTFFGLEEFINVTCLCESISKLGGRLKDAFEDCNATTLERSITHFVMLFANVDRQQTGSISTDTLKEILSMALNKELASIPFETILKTLNMNLSATINKMEFLSYIPYFLTFK